MFRKQNGFDSRMSSCENIENIITCKFQIKRKCQPRIYSDCFTCVLPVFALEKRTNLIRVCFVFLVVTDISGYIRKRSLFGRKQLTRKQPYFRRKRKSKTSRLRCSMETRVRLTKRAIPAIAPLGDNVRNFNLLK